MECVGFLSFFVCFWVACAQQVADGFNALGQHLHSELITTVAHRSLFLEFMALMKKDSINQVSMATIYLLLLFHLMASHRKMV